LINGQLRDFPRHRHPPSRNGPAKNSVIQGPPNVTHSLTVLDNETIEWLLNT